MGRDFAATEAKRERVPLLVGLTGPSGSGKTYTMLELLTGFQQETGGDIFVIDTEARRSLHYADSFTFKHLDFKAPFSPADYLAAIEHCISKGAKNIGIDSMSHEHEGQGGLLEMHDAEIQRLAGEDGRKQERVKFLAWVKPKHERQRLVSFILQQPVNFVFCFRAKEKLKLIPGKDPINMGWQAIAGEEFIYEQTLSLLLPPNSRGVPDLSPAEVGEKALVKVPQQFEAILKRGEAINRLVGKKLADWAAGAPAQTSPAGSGSTIAQSKALLAELGEILAGAPDQAAKKALLAVGFGGFSWRQVQEASLSNLQLGVGKIQAHLAAVEAQDQADRDAVELLSQDQVFEILGLARAAGIESAALQATYGPIHQLPASRFEEVKAQLVGNPAEVPDQQAQAALAL